MIFNHDTWLNSGAPSQIMQQKSLGVAKDIANAPRSGSTGATNPPKRGKYVGMLVPLLGFSRGNCFWPRGTGDGPKLTRGPTPFVSSQKPQAKFPLYRKGN